MEKPIAYNYVKAEEAIARLEAEVKAKQAEIYELNKKIGKLQIQYRLAEIEEGKE